MGNRATGEELFPDSQVFLAESPLIMVFLRLLNQYSSSGLDSLTEWKVFGWGMSVLGGLKVPSSAYGPYWSPSFAFELERGPIGVGGIVEASGCG